MLLMDGNFYFNLYCFSNCPFLIMKKMGSELYIIFSSNMARKTQGKCRVAKKKKKNDKYILLEGKRGK